MSQFFFKPPLKIIIIKKNTRLNRIRRISSSLTLEHSISEVVKIQKNCRQPKKRIGNDANCM